MSASGPGEKMHEILVSEEEAPRTVERGELSGDPADASRSCAPSQAERPSRSRGREYSSAQTNPLDVDAVDELLAVDGDDRRRRATSTMKVVTVLGTRPEIIRLSPVIERLDAALRARPRAHRAELRSGAQRRLLRRARRARPRPLPRHRGRELRGAGWAAILAAAARRCSQSERPIALLVLGDTDSAPVGARRQAHGHPGLPHGGRQPMLRRPRARRRSTAASSTSPATCCMPYTERSREQPAPRGHPRRAAIFVTGNPIKEVLDRHAGRDRVLAACSSGSASSAGEYLLLTAAPPGDRRRRGPPARRCVGGGRGAADELELPVICQRPSADARASCELRRRRSTATAVQLVRALRLLRLRRGWSGTRAACSPTAGPSRRSAASSACRR